MFASFRSTKIIFFFFLMTVLFGCQAQSKYSIIQEQPICNPPCWENITPGITTKNDVLSVLSANAKIQQPISDRQSSISSRFESILMFSLANDNKQGGSLYIQDGKVTVMQFDLNGGLSLQHAMEIFGDAESVLVYRGGEYIGISFFVPQKGIAYSYTSWGQKRWPEPPDWLFHEIKPEAEVNVVVFFVPSQTGPILDSGILSFGEFDPDTTVKRLYPWNGYGSVDKYR